MSEAFEAVVVGAGPAGLACALELAGEGVETLVLDRAHAPGAKSVGLTPLHGPRGAEATLEDAAPGFREEAPAGPALTGCRLHCVAGDRARSLDLTDLHEARHDWSRAPRRAAFDAWLAERAHEACREPGGGVVSGVHVEGPLVEDGEVAGVESRELDPIEADLVVAADGPASPLARWAGIRGWGHPDDWLLGVKAALEAPPADPSPDGRSLHLLAGDLFEAVPGTGFVLPHEDSVSVGAWLDLAALADGDADPARLLNRLLGHPLVQDLVGGDVAELEYAARLTPDPRAGPVEEPHRGRLLAVGAAARQARARGPLLEGPSVGVEAGVLAARAHLEARERDRPDSAGERYQRALEASRVPTAAGEAPGGELGFPDRVLQRLAGTGPGRRLVASGWGLDRVEGALNRPSWAARPPASRFGSVTLPRILAEDAGEPAPRPEGRGLQAPSLDERVEALDYRVDAGTADLGVPEPRSARRLVRACPVSAADAAQGCFRPETRPDGSDYVAVDPLACLECGACAVLEADWQPPPGGQGVAYEHG